MPTSLVEKAEALFEELFQSMGDPLVLHGDLHHYNILSAQREPWLAIDPKGVVGEAEYEVGAFMRNRLSHQPNPEEILKRRIDIFADILGFDKERMVGWGMAQAVLSLAWSIEDHGQITGQESIICANALARLL